MPTFVVNDTPTRVDNGASTSLLIQNTGSYPVFVQPDGVTIQAGGSATVLGWSQTPVTVVAPQRPSSVDVTLTAGSPGAGPGPGPLVVKPNGRSLTVTVSGASLFLDRGLTQAATFPRTVSSGTSFYAAAPASVTATASIGGTQVGPAFGARLAGLSAVEWRPGDGVSGDVGVGDLSADVRALLDGTYAARRSRLLLPGAPFVRQVMTTAPTVADGTTDPVTSSRTFAVSPTSNYMTLCAAGNFINNGGANGYSPAHIYPQTWAGRRYFRTLVGFDGLKIAFRVTSAPGHFYRFSVQEPGADRPQYITNSNEVAGSQDGGVRYLSLTFATAVPRIISLEMVFGDLWDVRIGPTDSLWAVQPRGPRCIIVGDSYVGGAGSPTTGYSGIGSWASSFADALGWQDVWNSGIGGTGWIQQASALPNAIRDRYAADIVAYSPDVVIFSAARNDFALGASAVGTAAGTVLAAVRSALPNAVLAVTGPNGSGSPTNGGDDTTWKPFQDAIFSAVSPYALTLDWSSSGIFTGSGKVGATSGTGNGDVYIQNDGVHPSTTGAVYLGRRIAEKFIAALPAA